MTVTELIDIAVGFDVCGGLTTERVLVAAHANFALQNAPLGRRMSAEVRSHLVSEI